MNKYATFTAAFGLALGSLHAQTVPLFVNYQGKITGGTGIPLGSTGTAPNFIAAPVNRKIIFRVFDAQTGGNRLWSEQQTVTISVGEFSVLLGQGTDAVYNAITESRPALDTVFTSGGAVAPAGPSRFLEIVVDDGNGTFTAAADLPISPRQRITSTAYSFRARVADTVAASTIDATALATGSVTGVKILDSAITTDKIANLAVLNEDLANSSVTTDKIADGAVGNADLANNAVNAAKIADLSVTTAKIADLSVTTAKIPDAAITGAKVLDGTIGTADLANGAVTSAKLDPNTVGFWSVNGANVFRAAGSVGVGTNTPQTAVTVRTATAGYGFEHTDGNVRLRSFIGGSNGGAWLGTDTNHPLSFYTNNSGTRMTISADGNVGIGTSNPGVPLDVVNQTTITMVDNGYQSNQGVQTQINGVPTHTATGANSVNGAGIELYGMSGGGNIGNDWNFVAPVSIRSEGWIASAKGITVYSDRRIKRDAKASVTGNDLKAIQQLKVTDYRMVDPGNGGMAWRKGFIAQEVEKVIPGAVTRGVEFVPDIFSVATTAAFDFSAKTLTLSLSKDHDLKVGERVRLHMDGSRLDLNVSAVPSAREFVVDHCDRAPEKVLVYGRQVNDFRAVDYDRIFTTSVGALQELKKEKDAEVKALQDENASLRTRLAALETSDKARDTKLAAIENLLLNQGKPAARTVSLKAGK